MTIRSVSQEILFGTQESVRDLVLEGADVNEKDIYGLTPLIEATLKEDPMLARFLLNHGARIDQEDISGQTALQWAVNREHKGLCELFLESGANPNHYSADGQPILVNPLLRSQNEMIRRLVDFGGDVRFAFDFVNAKLLGHRFELSGRARIINSKEKFIDLDYEGFYLEFTVGLVLSTLTRFLDSPQAKKFSPYFSVFSKIQKALKQSSAVIPFKYMKDGLQRGQAAIKDFLDQDLLVIPITYEGHAITFIRYKNWLAKCDRGVKHIVDTVVIYRIGKPITLTDAFLTDLLLNTKSSEFITKELKELLDLEPVATLPARYQLSGNCSWANVEASIPAMMFLLMFRGNTQARGEIASLKESIMKFYDEWVEWDKDRVLDETIAEFYQAGRLRRAAIASVLVAVLFQRCRASQKRELARAEKILSLLAREEYQYLLKTYLKVYYTKMAGKIGEEFVELLRACHVNLTTLDLRK